MAKPWYQPDWDLPPGVKAIQTLRTGGHSAAPYASNNLAQHVGDSPERVGQNRSQLRALLPCEPVWLNQAHSNTVSELAANAAPLLDADAAYTREIRQVCAVMTADCLPVLLCSGDGREVAAVHAGWRGLAAGIVTEAVTRFLAPAETISAYLCPAISLNHFEVGDDVLASFLQAERHRPYAVPVSAAFQPASQGKYHADLYLLARSELEALGVRAIAGGDRCTHGEQEHFFSYRRDGETGRMASLIWRES